MGHGSSKDHHHRKGRYSPPPPPSKEQRPPISMTKSMPTTSSVRKYDLSNFAVITVIFNPVGYKSRYNHYQKFEAHMAQSGVKLITVECIFESAAHFGLPSQKYEVTRAGDPRYIQVRAPSILWMKENLINVAIQRLPSNIEYVAWIDGDIEFEVGTIIASKVFFA